MKLSISAIGQAGIVLGILLISQSAYAQYGWCCSDITHAGGTATERCENNMITFAKSFECEAHKKEHDEAYGHDSTCSAGMGSLPALPVIAATDAAPATARHGHDDNAEDSAR